MKIRDLKNLSKEHGGDIPLKEFFLQKCFLEGTRAPLLQVLPIDDQLVIQTIHLPNPHSLSIRVADEEYLLKGFASSAKIPYQDESEEIIMTLI